MDTHYSRRDSHHRDSHHMAKHHHTQLEFGLWTYPPGQRHYGKGQAASPQSDQSLFWRRKMGNNQDMLSSSWGCNRPGQRARHQRKCVKSHGNLTAGIHGLALLTDGRYALHPLSLSAGLLGDPQLNLRSPLLLDVTGGYRSIFWI